MSEADKIFEELGYKKKEDIWKEDGKLHYIVYTAKDIVIEFYVDIKHIMISHIINMEELKAINKKCEELGWF